MACLFLLAEARLPVLDLSPFLPGVMTVAPEYFYDHEVIVKALRCVCVARGFVVMAYSSFVARSLRGKSIQCGRWPLCFALSGCLDDVVCDC